MKAIKINSFFMFLLGSTLHQFSKVLISKSCSSNLGLLLQVLLTKFRSLPPLFENTPKAVNELLLASNSFDSIEFYFFFVICMLVHL